MRRCPSFLGSDRGVIRGADGLAYALQEGFVVAILKFYGF